MNQAKAMQDIGIVPDASDVLKGSTLRSFNQYADEYLDLKAQIATLESMIEQRELKDKLTSLIADNDATEVRYGKYKFTIVSKETKRLDKNKLLENGVLPSVIAASTTTTNSSSLEVREIKSKGGE